MHGGLGRRLRAGALEVPQGGGAVAFGFALPELMIVVVLLGVLAGIAYGTQVNALDRVRSVVARFYVASQARACSYALVGDDVYVQTPFPSEMELQPSSNWSATCIRSAPFPISFTAAWCGESWTATIGSGGQISVNQAEAAIVSSEVVSDSVSAPSTTPPNGPPATTQNTGPPSEPPACERANGRGVVNSEKCS